MKSTNKWVKLDKVVLRVDNIEFIYKESLVMIFNCGFENISKGRCILKLNLRKTKKKKTLFVYTDKALMSVEIFYEKKSIDEIIKLFSLTKSSKKATVTLIIDDELLINEKNYLFIKNNLQIGVKAVEWKIPLN